MEVLTQNQHFYFFLIEKCDSLIGYFNNTCELSKNFKFLFGKFYCSLEQFPALRKKKNYIYIYVYIFLVNFHLWFSMLPCSESIDLWDGS